ncbi:hypothetical protein ACHAXN_010466 [Cyclotella atomus]
MNNGEIEAEPPAVVGDENSSSTEIDSRGVIASMNGMKSENLSNDVGVSKADLPADNLTGEVGQQPASLEGKQSEAMKVPVGQISNGDLVDDSPSLDHCGSRGDSDVKAADPQFAAESHASVLVNSIGSNGGDEVVDSTICSDEKSDDGLCEPKIDVSEKKLPLSPSLLKRAYSMPETSANKDPNEIDRGRASDVSQVRLPSASMSTTPIKHEQQKSQQQQQQQQQEIQQPNSQSSEDDDNSVNLPQTLQQSAIVEKSPAERYIRFKEKLGSGAYKDVYRAYDTIEGIEVAWNVVKLLGVPKAERVRIVNEVRLLERLHHPNIISFHGSWVNRETERVIFVTEILSSGTLKSFVSKVQLVRWKIFKRWAIQILKGLEYLHSQDPPIIHRDLKCDNIFINGTSGDLRIGDFGLSTAISKKNQPLSVLGTPEFMAPELYDESYDEKVDIYAFGMLLLEIATNQVPYHECSNPAQIYKKVISGIAPASLRRVKSDNAREFILLCLGIGKDASSRPSATELLAHPFLAKHPNDESTIEVEPAIEDMVIDETAPLEARPGSMRSGKGVSLTISDTASEFSVDRAGEQLNSKYSQSIDGHEIPSKGASSRPVEQEATRDESTVSSKQSEIAGGEADDHFGEMPENEANMKPVKVMMGRGKALDDESEPPTQQLGETSLSQHPTPVPPITVLAPAPIQVYTNMTRSISEADNSSMGSVPQYKVSSVPNPANPSPNEAAINLALTLPDENQTTVEFEFDLVNDDPVQVAKEMVMELDEVPNDAVLDISEAISGVARHARQQNFLQQQQQHHFLIPSSQGMPPQQQQQQQQQPGIGGQQNIMNNTGYPGISYQTPGAPILQPQLGVGGDMNTSYPQRQAQNLQYQTPSGTLAGGDSNPTIQQQSIKAAAMNYQTASAPPTPQQHVSDQHQQNVPFQTPAWTTMQQGLGFQSQTPAGSLSQQQQQDAHAQISVPHHLRIGSDFSVQQAWQSNQAPPQPPQMPIGRAQQLPPRPASTPQLTQQHSLQQNAHPLISTGTDDIPATQRTSQVMQSNVAPTIHETQSSYGSATAKSLDSGAQSAPAHLPQHKEAAIISAPPHMVVVPETSELEDGNDAEIYDEELKKLEEEFEKRLQRAKKSYGTRMDNLQRSKFEAETQHQMTLEKHEKERIEFEKRVRLAEEEQNRRLNQIEKEFQEKKDKFRQQRQNDEKPPLHGGHKRSSSHFEPSLQCPTPASDVRRNASMSHPNSHPGHHKRDHSTQSSISFSASDVSADDHLHVDSSPKAPLSGGLYVEDNNMKPPPNSHPVRQVESSASLRDKERSDSTSSQA